jgi:hypothetical protein
MTASPAWDEVALLLAIGFVVGWFSVGLRK